MNLPDFKITEGVVWRSDEDNGTTRPTWCAKLEAETDGHVYYTGEGDGKAPHVALKRAVDQICYSIRSAEKRKD